MLQNDDCLQIVQHKYALRSCQGGGTAVTKLIHDVQKSFLSFLKNGPAVTRTNNICIHEHVMPLGYNLFARLLREHTLNRANVVHEINTVIVERLVILSQIGQCSVVIQESVRRKEMDLS